MENNERILCTICYLIEQVENNPFVKTKCNHVMCLKCVEIVVSHSHTNQRSISSWNDVLEQHPTQAKCPYCRAYFSFFDIQPLDPNIPCHFRKSEIPSMLRGTVYAVKNKIGYQSIHFPHLKGISKNNLPYIRMDHHEIKDIIQSSSPKKQPKKIRFEPGYSFHKKSNTFYGILKLNKVSFLDSSSHILCVNWFSFMFMDHNLEFFSRRELIIF